MATVSNKRIFGGMEITKWTLTNADTTGDPTSTPGAPDKTVHIFGTFNSGSVTIQGCNQEVPEVWATMHDHAGADMTFTAAGMKTLAENPIWIRPIVASATAGASIQIILANRG